MSINELRSSQLLTTFGPGALVDFPDKSVIIGGTQDWVYEPGKPLPIIKEARLEAKLRYRLKRAHVELRLPPLKKERFGVNSTFVRSYQFPLWLQVQDKERSPKNPAFIRRRLVHRDSLENGRFRNDANILKDVVPVRFIRACPNGHIGDINWPHVVHGAPSSHRLMWLEERGPSGALSETYVVCECGQEKSLSVIFKSGNEDLGFCNGSRPWLGAHSSEVCTHRNRALIRSASNAYFPQLLSVISIPDLVGKLELAISDNWAVLQNTDNAATLAAFLRIPEIKKALTGFPESDILQAIESKRDGKDILGELNVKEVEFQALIAAESEMPAEIPVGDFFAREIPLRSPAGWDFDRYIEKVVAVHSLREVTALLGFTRLEPIAKNVDGELDATVDLEVRLAEIGKDQDWLPAIENHGEGIFVQLKQSRLDEWLNSGPVQEYLPLVQEGFSKWQADHPAAGIPFPDIRYYMVHSLCHILLTTIILECGYPASSLKERVYQNASGTGFLIYTASPDAAGTLGGLTQAGRDLGRHLAVALEGARLCSNDPICSSHLPNDSDKRFLSGASCHSCLHIPETSCEQWNEFLDRRLVVETLDRKGTAFFS